MPEAKIEFTIGNISFIGEGEQQWVAEQLDKILDKAPDLLKLSPRKQITHQKTEPHETIETNDETISKKTLPVFLNEKNATSNQLNKFLATAIWLHAKGKKRLKTSDVTSALKEAQQSRLGNPSDCLNKNVRKGYIEKDGSEFFVTQEGRKYLNV